MTDSTQHQLLGHLLNVLEDDEQQWLEWRLEHNEEYRRQWMYWRRRLAPLEALRPDFEPPPGLAERTCRFVAARAPVKGVVLRWEMSPDGALPSRAAQVGWRDVIAVALLLMITVAVVLPAIHGSRFQARVTSCQDNLRRFGLALTGYSHQHGGALSQFADNGTLTDTGVLAAGVLEESFALDDSQDICPDAWLAAQGAPCAPSHDGNQPDSAVAILAVAAAGIAVPEIGPQLPLGPQHSQGVDVRRNNWPGTWRDGTTAARLLSQPPAALPLLADAPSADLPGQPLDSHGGQGRNLFFEDGHVAFLPHSTPTNDAVEKLLSPGGSPAAPSGSVPVTFVNWR